MKHPHFLVVGAARSGTTALHHYLIQHPKLFLPKQKEPCFFTFAEEKINYQRGKFSFAVNDLREYSKLFSDSLPEQVTGEISTPYLYLHERTIGNIYKYHSEPESLKIIILLRNPVDRAYSQYLMKVSEGREELSFEEALSSETTRIEDNFSFDYFYADRGLYYPQVRNYLKHFNSVKIFLYEDFRSDPQKTLSQICRFLNVDDTFVFKRREEINRSSAPRSKILGKIVTTESKLKFKMLNILPADVRLSMKQLFTKLNSRTKPIPVLSAEVRISLEEFFYDDINKLSHLTGKDLSHWITLFKK